MNINRSGLFWGILLVGAGLLGLARQLGYIDNSSAPIWIGVFALVSLLALINYFLSGWNQWGWLFPAGIFGGLAVTTALASAGVDNAAIASPIFFGLLLPFAAAYLVDRVRNWWALIPGGIILFLAFVTLLADSGAGGEWIGALFLFMIAASFFFVYLANRTRGWALIVTYAVGVLGIGPLMAINSRYTAFYGPIFLLAVALPFLIVYFRSLDNWWAIIPAGVMASLAIVTILALSGWIESATEGGYANAVLMAGLAVTFAIVWLRHGKSWAKIVTLALAVVALASVFLVTYWQMVWPVVVILAGLYFFYLALRPKTA